MKFKNSISIGIALMLFCLAPLFGKKAILSPALANQSSVGQSAIGVFAYLSLFNSAYEQYLQNNKQLPSISCKKCHAHELGFSEFQGGVVGKAFNDLVAGKGNFEQIKSNLDACLMVLSDGNCTDITNCMIRIANETWPVCAYCGYDGQGDSWGNNLPELTSSL